MSALLNHGAHPIYMKRKNQRTFQLAVAAITPVTHIPTFRILTRLAAHVQRNVTVSHLQNLFDEILLLLFVLAT